VRNEHSTNIAQQVSGRLFESGKRESVTLDSKTLPPPRERALVSTEPAIILSEKIPERNGA